ncbi:MAG: 50S ribosomal protein L11 methyltransferase [Dehalococcoidia bacterium]|nr:50S ribosomal protein L11 methyltransferase [Dehalococcoidia bacterium]
MKWHELSIKVSPEISEAIEDLFRKFGYGGAIIEQPILEGDDAEEYSIDNDSPVLIRTYLPADTKSIEAISNIKRGLAALSLIMDLPRLSEREVDEDEWNQAWRAHFPVLRIGKRIIIKPSWRKYTKKAADYVVIKLDPGSAFGSGQHPTTRLCLKELEVRVTKKQNVLDLGTGSGILAMAAAKLGASSVLAIDIDSVSVRAAFENVVANRLTRKVRVELDSLPLSRKLNLVGYRKFDLVVANLTGTILTKLSPFIPKVMSPDGQIIASGIIDSKLESTLGAFKSAGLYVERVRKEGDWRLVVATFQKVD